MKHVACFLLLLICLIALPGATFIQAEPVELAYFRTATSRTWANPEGSYTGEFHVDADPIHQWVPLLGWVPANSLEGSLLAATGLLMADSYINQDTTSVAINSGCGKIYFIDPDYATCRASATGTVDTTVYWMCGSDRLTGPSNRIYRGYIPINTTSLDDAAILLTANLRITPNTVATGSGASGIDLVSSTQVSPTALTATDYAAIGSVKYATEVATTSLSNNILYDWPMNATGLAAVNKTGYTQLGLRYKNDLDNVQPGGVPPLNNEVYGNVLPVLRLNYDIVYQRGKGMW